METEKINKPPARKYGYILLIVFLLLFMAYFVVMAMIAPGKKLKSWKNEYSFRQDEKSMIDESILTDSAFLSIFREKASLQARTAMAETDSIYLSMNLTDSIVSLEISGVTVSSTKLTRISVSRMLRDRNAYVISSMLSRPFTVERNYSSIQKEPLMIKMAPRDTSEYKPDIIPDTADYEPVNYIMEMDNGAVILVYQEEKINPGDRLHLFFFDMQYRMLNAWRSLKSVMTLKVPEYHPFIKVRLPRSDAKIIYRGLPEHGQISVYR